MSITESLDNISKMDLLKGNVHHDIMHKLPSEIRVFISSTFKDFQLERDYIIEILYSELKDYCRKKYQINFLMIDMRWGITSEAMKNQIVTETDLHEVEKCKTDSIGPHFVALIGHRYGQRFLNSKIERNEFELIIKEADLIKSDVSRLLKQCYRLDENNIENQKYQLKSIGEILRDLQMDERKWQMCERYLIEKIQEIMSLTNKKEDINKFQKDYYFASVTEQEIKLGILNEPNASQNCLAFFRHITELNDQSDDSDEFYQKGKEKIRLETLKSQVSDKLPKENKKIFEINWSRTNSFKAPYTYEVKKYLKDFKIAFYSSMIKLIDNNVKKLESQKEKIYSTELFHHASFCNRLFLKMKPRFDLSNKIKMYLDDDSKKRPLIITGKSGSGKSSLIAYTIKKLKNTNDIFIYRFLGTSRETSNIKIVLKSILNQLEALFEIPSINEIKHFSEEQPLYESVRELRHQLRNKLNEISTKHLNSRLVIILDAIDQLSEFHTSSDWILYDLPSNIKIIYSILEDHNLFNEIKNNVELGNNFLTIGHIDCSVAQELISDWMSKSDRQLTKIQSESLNMLLSKVNKIYPLHIKIIFDIIKSWPSWYNVENEFLDCITKEDSIKYLFRKNELLNGKVLFSRCIFYLTLFEYNGISEPELEDILSIDDVVLNSVFVHHHPPVRRFQIALWLVIKYELSDYITNKEVDNVSVISWFHHSFIEASKEYYKDMFEPSDLKDSLLLNVIDYFTEKYNKTRSDETNGEKKQFQFNFKELKNFESIKTNNETMYLAYRNTQPQKIKNFLNQGKLKYNSRKLKELVNIISMLQNSKMKIELLKEHIYFNYEFMHAKFELNDLDFIIESGNPFLANNNEETLELNEIIDVYKRIHPLIRQNPDLLTTEVLSRLEKRSKYTKQLSEPHGLYMISKGYNRKEIEKELFVDSNRIKNIYLEYNGPLVFVESKTKNKDADWTALFIIDSVTSKLIRSIDIDLVASNLQILLDETNFEKTKNDYNGFINISSANCIACYNFLGILLYKRCFEDDICNLVLLNSIYLLVTTKKHLTLLKTEQNSPNIEMTIENNDEIELIETNIPKETVFSNTYLSKIDSIAVIVGLLNSKVINIYKFYKNKLSFICCVDKIKWNYFGYGKWFNDYETWRKSIIIEDEFMIINNNETSNSDGFQIRFALQEKVTTVLYDEQDKEENNISKTITKIIEVNDKNKKRYDKIIEIDEDKLVIQQIDKYIFKNFTNNNLVTTNAELIGFQNKKIILKIKIGISSWLIYTYDTESKKITKSNEIKNINEVQLISENGVIIAKGYRNLEIYKIDEEIVQINRFHLPWFSVDNKYNDAIKIKNDKLLIVDHKEKSSITEIEILFNKNLLNDNHNIKLFYRDSENGLRNFIDEQHLLVQLETKDKSIEIGVFNVSQSRIVHSQSWNEERFLGCNEKYFVLLSSLSIYVYKIKNKEGSFSFKETYKGNIKKKLFDKFHRINKCQFDDNSSEKFSITLIEEKDKEKYIKVKQIECGRSKTLYNFKFKKIELETEFLDHFLTSLNKILCIFEKGKKIIYYVFTKYIKLELDNEVWDVQCVPNTNNLIVKGGNSLQYVIFDVNKNDFVQIKLKEYKQQKFWVKIKNEHLFIYEFETYKLEIYKLAELIKKNCLEDPISVYTLYKDLMQNFVSINDEYLSYIVEKQISVYKKDYLFPVGTIQLNDTVSSFISNDKFICVVLKEKKNLVTFEIIDKSLKNTSEYIQIENELSSNNEYVNRTIFKAEKGYIVKNVFFHNTEKILFILSQYKATGESVVFLIESESMSEQKVELGITVDFIHFQYINNMKDHDSKIYMTRNNELYVLNYNSEPNVRKKINLDNKNKIIGVIVIGVDTILVVYHNALVVVYLKKDDKHTFETKNYGYDQIQFFDSTLSMQNVYSFDRVNTENNGYIYVIVGLEVSKTIKVYKFHPKTNKILEYTIKDFKFCSNITLCIDKICLFERKKEISLRFLIADTNTKNNAIYEFDNNFEMHIPYKNILFDTKCSIVHSNEFVALGLNNDIVFIKKKVDSKKWILAEYDFRNNKMVEIEVPCDRLRLIGNEAEYFLKEEIEIYNKKLELCQIKENKCLRMLKLDFSTKTLFRNLIAFIKDDNFYYLENDSNTLYEVALKNQSCFSHCSFSIKMLLSVINKDTALVEIHRNDNFTEFSIINAKLDREKSRKLIERDRMNLVIKGFKEFLVIFDTQKFDLFVYHIGNNEFSQININEPLGDNDHKSRLWFDYYKEVFYIPDKKICIVFYDQVKNGLNIFDVFTSKKYEKRFVDLKAISDSCKEMDFIITPKSEMLFVWQYEEDFIYSLNSLNKNFFEIDDIIYEVIVIPESDNMIIKCEKSIIYFNTSTGNRQNLEIPQMNNAEYKILIQDIYLAILNTMEKMITIYVLDKIFERITYLTKFDDKISNCQIMSNILFGIGSNGQLCAKNITNSNINIKLPTSTNLKQYLLSEEYMFILDESNKLELFDLNNFKDSSTKRLEKYKQAIRSFDKAIILNPNCYEAHIAKAEIYLTLNQKNEALICYKEALQSLNHVLETCDEILDLKPDSAEGYCNKGVILKKICEIMKCIDDLDDLEKPTVKQIAYHQKDNLKTKFNVFEDLKSNESNSSNFQDFLKKQSFDKDIWGIFRVPSNNKLAINTNIDVYLLNKWLNQ